MSRKRDDLPLAAVQRQLVNASGIQGVRVSADAVSNAQHALEHFLMTAGQKSAAILKLQKKATVNRVVIEAVLVAECNGVRASDLVSNKRAGEVRGLPQAGVERVFRSHLGGSNRLSGDGGAMLVAASEAYLRALGSRAGILAKAGKRTTIKAADIADAMKLLA